MYKNGLKKFVSIFLFKTIILLFFLFFNFQVYAATNTWDFDSTSNYNFSNSNSFSVNDSIASLTETFNHVGSVTSTNLDGIFDVVVDGNYAYMTSGNNDSFNVIDISNPASPSIISTLSNNGGSIRLDGAEGIVKDGSYVYIASRVSDAVQIIDVSNPTNPIAVSQITNSPTSNELNGARGIVKNGNYLYVSCSGDHSIVVIDVSNPISPVWITALVDTTNLRGTRYLEVSGNYLYVTAYLRDRVTSIDISNPNFPFIADSITDSRLDGAWNIELSGNYAFVSSDVDDSVQVIDISNPNSLSIVASINDGGNYLLTNPRDLLINGNILFVTSNGDDAVNAIDISNPLSPVFLNSIIHSAGLQELNGARGIFNVGNRYYIASGVSDGLEILDYGFDNTSPTTIPNSGFNYGSYDLLSFSELLGSGNEGTITYQISKDNGNTWYYHNGNSWQTTTQGTSNSNNALIINNNISSFNTIPGGTNTFLFKAFFNSNGTQKVELDRISIEVSGPPSPGGVSGNLQIWLKADKGTSTTVHGNSLTTWGDQSGNGYDAGGGISPTYLNNDTNNLNFNPIIDFNGTTQYLQNLNNGSFSHSYYMVIVPDSTIDGTIAGQVPFSFDCFSGNLSSGICGLSYAGLTLGAFTAAINDEVITHALGSSTNWRSSQIGIASYEINRPMLVGINENISANGTDIYEKGEKVDNFTSNSYQTLSSADYGLGKSLDISYPYYYDGKIAEVINYNSRISDSDREKIESYLALKYGITLQSGLKDYIASDGVTNIWSSSLAGVYINDIFGIGRDDGSELGQVKSRSVNSDNIITIEALGEGTNFLPSFVDISDKEFLTIANNAGGNTWVAIDSPSGYNILSRSWKVQEIGDLGTVNLEFDVGNLNFDIPDLSAGTNYYFLYDTDNDNIFSDEIPQLMTNITGNIWQISGINLSHLHKFTIATQASTNNIPTDIILSNDNLNENVPVNTVVGTLSTIDNDLGDPHTYSLISGLGDTDNLSFNIIGNTLYINESPDYEIKSNYNIRLQTDDGNGGQYQKQFIVYINNVGETINSIIDFENPGKYSVTSGTWARTTNNPNEGSYSIESDNGGINSTQSCFEITNTFNTTGTITFDYNVSSALGSDYLRFYIDNLDIQNWSGNVSWTTYTKNDIIPGNHQYKWCYIKDNIGSSGLDKAFIDYITFSDTAIDITNPSIININFISGSLLPGGNHDIIINYVDSESGIDTNSDIMELYKWDGSSWGTNIAVTGLNLGTKIIDSTSVTYPTNNLSSGKYRFNFQISDNNANSASTGAIFYIDKPEIIVNTGSFDIGILPIGSQNFSNDEITITIKTVGAGFQVHVSKDLDFSSTNGNIIIDWDGLKGIGYDIFPYSGVINNVNDNPIIATQAESINSNGFLNTYTYSIKIGTLIDENQAAGDYTTNLSFYLYLTY